MEPALARVGLHPDRVIYCETRKDADVLPAMEEGLRRGGRACTVAADAVAPLATGGGSLRWGRLRFAALGQRIGRSQCGFSRSRISPSPSGSTVDLDMGLDRWRVDLLRCRGRKPTALLWRPTMRRVVSLSLPSWATDRLRRRNGGLPQPEVAISG